MKLALITDSYLLADSISANFIQVLAEGLYHIGHDVLIVTPELDRHHAEMEGQVLLCAGKKNWNAAGLQLSGEGVKQMTEALDAFHPDLLHIHTLSETGAYALQYAEDHRIPALLTVHSMADLQAGARTLAPWSILREKKRLKTTDYVLEHAPKITVLSEAMAKSMYQQGIRISETLFPSAINNDLFHLNAASPAQQQELINSLTLRDKKAVICGDCEDEALYEFLESWSRAFSPKDPVHLLIMQRDSQTDDLRSAIHSLHLSRQVTLIGNLPQTELPACYALSSCYISCSRTEELRISAMESAACGTPILIRKNGGSASIITEGHNGFLWSTENELFGYVRKFLQIEGQNREALARIVCKTVRSLTPQNQARAAETFYQSLLS